MQVQLRYSALFLLTLPFMLASCDGLRGRGDLVQEDRTVDDEFHGLAVSVPGKVVVNVGPQPSLHIQCEETVLPYLITRVEGDGLLHIYFGRPVYDVDDLVITVTGPDYDRFDLSGSGNVVCTAPLTGSRLDVDVSGSGDMLLNNVDFTDIEAHVSGSGQIRIKGQADELEAAVSGSGNLFAEDCPVKTADVHVSGSGDLNCHVTDQLKASVSGSGDVRYRGQPQLEVHISGSGEVKPL